MKILKSLFGKKKLSESEFALKYFGELEKQVEGIQLVHSEGLEMTTSINGENEFKHFLNNAYSEYQNAPEELEEIIERYALALKDLITSKNEEINLQRIIPTIKDKRYLIENKDIGVDTLLYEEYNSNLYIFYAEDKESHIHYLSEDDLPKLGVDFPELRAMAVENLKAIIPEIQRQGDEGLFGLTTDGDNEAGLILFDIWNTENFPVEGEIVVGIPARDVLLITGTEHKDQIEKMKEIIKDIHETGDHLISEKLFILKDGKFEVWE